MQKLTIRLENPLDEYHFEYSLVMRSDGVAQELAEWLGLLLPHLLEDSIALYTKIKVYAEPFSTLPLKTDNAEFTHEFRRVGDGPQIGLKG